MILHLPKKGLSGSYYQGKPPPRTREEIRAALEAEKLREDALRVVNKAIRLGWVRLSG